MRRRPKPHVANRPSPDQDVRVVEFYDPILNLGGLISISREDRVLHVQAYCCDEGVVVGKATRFDDKAVSRRDRKLPEEA